uniref:Phosphatidylinositol 3-kinase regulatory subunit n=1 Tax=Anopheles atroparvus TaxID=41427 RepID=A0AAG5D8K6_ANOAO
MDETQQSQMQQQQQQGDGQQQQQQQQQKEQQQKGFATYCAEEDNKVPQTVDELAYEKGDVVHVWIPSTTKPQVGAGGGSGAAWYKATNVRTKQTGFVQLHQFTSHDTAAPYGAPVYLVSGHTGGGSGSKQQQFAGAGAVAAPPCVSIGCACLSSAGQQQQQQQSQLTDILGELRLAGKEGATAGSDPTASGPAPEDLYVQCVTPGTDRDDPSRDYIWGLGGRQGGQCRNCSACFHFNCLPLAILGKCQRNPEIYPQAPPTYKTEKSINEWTTTNVLEWLAAVNMYDHVEVFKTKAIKGCDLPNLDRDKLEQMGIKNEFHQQTILTTIKHLLTSGEKTASLPTPMADPNQASKLVLGVVPVGAKDGQQLHQGHHLIDGSFSKQQKCDMCKQFLFGLVHQGLFCTQCNLVVHRQCSVTGLTPCSAAVTHQHQQQSMSVTGRLFAHHQAQALLQQQGYVFAKGLCLQFDATQQKAPQIVIDLCSSLERMAQQNPTVDLYVIYRTTPPRYDDVNKLRDALNENLLNIDLNGYAPECVATVLKKFFHELPDPVIPVMLYEQFIEASKLGDMLAAEKMQQLIQVMPTHHSKTLHYFMQHLIRICQLQYKRGNKQQPTMLLQNWCHILMRPAWERIVQFVGNIKNHLRILEILMYKLNWNEPLPEFLSIPAVPPRKTSRSSSGSGTSGGQSSGSGVIGASKKMLIASPEGPEYEYAGGVGGSSSSSSSRYTGSTGGGVVGPIVPVSSQIMASRTLVTDPDTPAELREAEWYWGKISRDVAKEKMMDAPDGSFLVRDAISDAGEYTLVLKKDGADRPIKIYHKNGLYGFTQEGTYGSLVQLINEYRTQTLKEYNTILDICLLYPVSRFEDDIYPTEEDVHQLAQNFYDTVQRLNDMQNVRETINESITETQSHVELRKQALEAFTEAEKLFNEQLQIQAQYEKEAQPHEKRSLAQNRTLIELRLDELHRCKTTLDGDTEQEKERVKELQRELRKLNPEILNLAKQKDQYLEALKRQAVTDSQIKQILNDGYLSPSSQAAQEQMPHMDDATWLRERFSRQDAEQVLAGKPTGTFLIRARSAGHHALSIACNGCVNHCIIQKTERGYGFAEPYFIYDSLKSLVVHYASNSLEEHNDLLQTTLKYPAFAPIPITGGSGGNGGGNGGGGGSGSGPSTSGASSSRQHPQASGSGMMNTFAP